MGLSILITGNYEVIRRGIRAMLETVDALHICGEASTVGETLDQVYKLRPDMVLLDLAIPDLNPPETIPRVLKLCPHTKVVGWVPPGAEELALKVMSAGASGLAMKSGAATDLVATMLHLGSASRCSPIEAVKPAQGEFRDSISGEGTPDLTPREQEILRLLAHGRANREIATVLNVSVRTVDTHRANIMHKLKLTSYYDLIQFGIRHKLTER